MILHYTDPKRLARREFRLKYFVLVTVVLLIAGCTGLSVQSHITKAQEETGSIVQHTQGIDEQVQTVTGNEPQKKAITKHTAGIRDDAATILNNLASAIKGDSKKDDELKFYRENLLVQAAVFVWKWLVFFKWAAIVLACLYPVTFILGLFNPATAAYRIYETLDGLLPAIQPVRWLHEVLDRRTVSVPATVVTKATVDSEPEAPALELGA